MMCDKNIGLLFTSSIKKFKDSPNAVEDNLYGTSLMVATPFPNPTQDVSWVGSGIMLALPRFLPSVV